MISSRAGRQTGRPGTLVGRPKARRAYRWSTGQGDARHLTAVLEIPPVKGALTAVRASIVSQSKK